LLRLPRAEGGRKIFTRLTPAGRALKDVLVPMAEEMNEIAVRGLREADIAATRRILLAMVANLAEDENEAAKEDRRMPLDAGGSAAAGVVGSANQLRTRVHARDRLGGRVLGNRFRRA